MTYASRVGTNGHDTLGPWATADHIRASSGNDTIFGGDQGDLIEAGSSEWGRLTSGADVTFIGDNDSIDAGAGDDRIIIGSGTDTIVGGTGVDTISFGSVIYWDGEFFRTANWNGVSVDLSAGQYFGELVDLTLNQSIGSEGGALSGIELVNGTTFNDTLQGSDLGDTLWASFGDDLLDGRGGGDQLRGEGGADTITGGSGNDTLTGDLGSDTIDGGADDDDLQGGEDPDSIIGGLGIDTIIGGSGADTIDGGDGADVINYFDEGGSLGVNVNLVNGRTSTDSFGHADVLRGIENVRGTERADTISANDAVNVIGGRGGNDTIKGFGGDDSLYGGDADDLLLGGTGNDLISGGFGVDTVDYGLDRTLNPAFLGGLAVALNVDGCTATIANSVGETDTLEGINNVLATAFNDTVTGDGNHNKIDGRGGDDELAGGNGIDTILGGVGNDTIRPGGTVDSVDGGAGTDTLDYTGLSNFVELDLRDQANANSLFKSFENVVGGSGNDEITGDLRANILSGEGGNDTLIAQGFNDSELSGGDGADSLSGGQYAFGDAGDDTIAGAKIARGGDDQDILTAIAEGSRLEGENGDDRLEGADRNDDLLAGAGSDTVVAGGGNDVVALDDALDTNAIAGLRAGGSNFDQIVLAYFAEPHETGGNTADGGNGNDVILGASGIDLIDGGFGRDRLFGGAGNDVINGGADGDELDGDEGLDRLDGGAGDDTIFGGESNDTLTGGTGDDTLSGGDGLDTADYSASTLRVRLTLADDETGVVLNGTERDTLSTIENVIGGSSHDIFVGAASANRFEGRGGNDSLAGSSGRDTLDGGEGNDTLNGGVGVDWLDGGSGRDAFLFDAALTAANADRVQGFVAADDVIRLDDAVFAGLAVGGLASGAFRIGTAAADANDRIVYNSATGVLLFDADGNGAGAAQRFAVLEAGVVLTEADFVVV